MGANASGKTALRKVLMGAFNFISKKEYALITDLIEDTQKDASFSIDMAFDDNYLYRVSAQFKGRKKSYSEIRSEDILVEVKKEKILKSDSYEKCVKRLEEKSPEKYDSYIQALESIPFITWNFELRFVDRGIQRVIEPFEPNVYTAVLEETLKALDPRIIQVKKIEDRGKDNTFIIDYKNHSVLIKDGIVMEAEKLSSGTADGVGIAGLITSIKLKATNFIYCDEKFAQIHPDAEKAFLALMTDMLDGNQQLFFTTHNTDILDLNLPFHTFAFLRRDESDDNNVSCIYASDYLKKNNQSLKNAVENDLFSTSPDTDSIYRLNEIFQGGLL
jgi:AAA15 family ATPase/GTPase